MKKIIFITWALEVGGAERLLVKLVQNIPTDKYKVKVICITRRGIWAKEVEEFGIEVVSMNKKVGLDLGVFFRLCTYLKKEQPDLVNTSIWTADLWGRLAAICAGVKHIIVTEQNVDLWKRWYHRAIDRLLFHWTEFVICVSDDVRSFYHDRLGVPDEKLRMIPNAIDLELFTKDNWKRTLRTSLQIEESEFLFICPARLHPQKAHQVMIQAAHNLIQKGTCDFKILLVGEGVRRQELEKIVRGLRLENIVLFLGLRQDVPDLLLQSDAFLLSSEYEGLSLSVLEGMAARLPIVATRVGGNAQLVQDGRNGYLVPPHDPTALSIAMEKVMADRTDSRKMGAESFRIVNQSYGIKQITAQTLELFALCFEKNAVIPN